VLEHHLILLNADKLQYVDDDDEMKKKMMMKMMKVKLLQ